MDERTKRLDLYFLIQQVFQSVIGSLSDEGVLSRVFDRLLATPYHIEESEGEEEESTANEGGGDASTKRNIHSGLIESLDVQLIEAQLGPGSAFLERRCRSATKGVDELIKQVE